MSRQVNVIMLDTSEAAQRPRGCAEVRSGIERRRRWTDEDKGRIVAEAIAPGAVIARVARRHDMTSQHLSNWIRAAKAGSIPLPEEAVAFVPVIADRGRVEPAASGGPIEITTGGLTVRVPCGIETRTLEIILRALRRA